MQKILIAVDGSELSLDAVRHALALRRQGLEAEFVLANVQEPASLYELLTIRDPERVQGMTASAGDHLLERARELCNAAGASYECEIASGDPAHTLLDIAERFSCDAIIVGARGHGGLLGTHLGSVSQVLAETSSIPVTVVKHAAFDAAGEFARHDTSRPADPEVVIGLA
ncbi:universal stress protein [Caenimonas aquaedulcis]|uniref:Universal stress protein n=1 Tax=Caenimonas aquaedulcis TaxID=2793270 RepID=A0A931MHX4_9BURK|nr:universal stress protein [Caenimonas aquaedulcis]MBG9389387.1 universal stress protein [Caenimonas aquaedulcis]